LPDDEAQQRLLSDAIREGDIEAVQRLCSRLDINARPEEGETLLGQAVEHGQEAIVKLLISLGADVNLEDEPGGLTPLARAVDVMRDIATWSMPSDSMVRLLLECGADPDQPCFGGRKTPMKMAAAGELVYRGVNLVPLLERYRKHPPCPPASSPPPSPR
jgi:hypothetical protein